MGPDLTWGEFLQKSTEMQEEMMKLDQELKNKKEIYRAFTRAHIGIADGDPTNVIEVAKMVKLVLAK